MSSFFLLFFFLGSSEACSNFQCPTGGYCVETASGQPSCHCPLCGGEWDPVCGTDGVTYTNPCRLRYESCRHNKSLSIVYKGLCSKSIYSICSVKMLLLLTINPNTCKEREREREIFPVSLVKLFVLLSARPIHDNVIFQFCYWLSSELHCNGNFVSICLCIHGLRRNYVKLCLSFIVSFIAILITSQFFSDLTRTLQI